MSRRVARSGPSPFRRSRKWSRRSASGSCSKTRAGPCSAFVSSSTRRMPSWTTPSSNWYSRSAARRRSVRTAPEETAESGWMRTPPLRRGHRDVLGFPVLVRVRLQQELAQHVVRHPSLPLRGMDPRLPHRARDGPGERPVDPRRRPARIEARVAAKDVEDVRTSVPPGLRGEVHPRAGPAVEPAPHSAAGQEYDGFDIRPALPGERLLRSQESGQLLRLAVRQQERTVDQELLAVDLAAPRARVARDGPAPAS